MEEKNEGIAGRACSSEERGRSHWTVLGSLVSHDLLSSFSSPSFIPHPLDWLAENHFLLILFLAADPRQYTEGPAAQRAASLAGSRGLWAFSSESNTSFLCGFLCSDPIRCSKEGGAVKLRELPGHSVFGPSFETPTRRDPGGCGPQ